MFQLEYSAMDILETLLLIGGVLGALVSGLLICARREEGDEDSGWWLADAFILGGIISFICGVARGISDLFYGRSSGSLVLIIVFIVSILMISVSFNIGG
jgi:hypothetical protein